MKKHELSLQVGLVRRSDIGKEMTQRNANERRRLDGQLKSLDQQLHSKLVHMQAEIMELKNSPYGEKCTKRKMSPRALVSRERANSDSGLRVSRSAKTIRGESHQSPAPNRREKAEERQDIGDLVLPEIDLKSTSLVSNALSSGPSKPTPSRLQNNTGNNAITKVSSRGQNLLQLPSSSSLYRPSSLPDLRPATESLVRLSPVSIRRKLLPSPEPWDGNTNLTATSLSKQNNFDNNKVTSNQFISKDKTQKLNSEEEQELPQVIPEIRTEIPTPDTEPKSEESEEIDSLFYNSMMAKVTYGENFNEVDVEPDLASMGFMDFNDVIDKRLKQSQEELPDEEEMRKIRYLRWNEKQKESDLVKEVFENRDST